MRQGDDAIGAIRGLRADPRGEIRLLAIPASAGVSTDRRLREILEPLLADEDADVRNSAATAIVFVGTRSSLSYLVGHAIRDCGKTVSLSPQADYAAASATAGLARSSNPTVGPVLCAVLLTHPTAAVRAQAAESLGGYLKDNPERDSASATSSPGESGDGWGFPPCDPIEALQRATHDEGRFSGLLAVEREIEVVAGVMASRRGTAVEGSSSGPADVERTVGEIASRALSELNNADAAPPASHSVSDGPEIGKDGVKE